MGISPQLTQDFNSTKNDKDLIETQNVQDFNSYKKISKIPDYAKDYKNEYLFIIGIDGCFGSILKEERLFTEDIFERRYLYIKKQINNFKRLVDINNLPKINPENVIFNTLRLKEKLDELQIDFNESNREVLREYGTVFIGLDDAYPGFFEMKELVLEFINIFKNDNDNDNEINIDSDSDSYIFNEISNTISIIGYSYSDSDIDSDSEIECNWLVITFSDSDSDSDE